MDYDDAYEWGDFIANEVESKHMPPWPADPSYRHFKDEAVLTDLEIDQILDWVDAGMPTGDLATAPDRLGSPPARRCRHALASTREHGHIDCSA